MLSPTTTHQHPCWIISVVDTLCRSDQCQCDTMTRVKQNHIHSHIPTPFRIISFIIRNTDMKYDLELKYIL